ncbi:MULTISPECIES: AMP-binding protein [unclassified Halomonas]|uniref:AMP-binding protein n=1 Tax=unclassified Halomonas TaxID=2609666 RepID=UPI002076A4AE|nr:MULTISPECIES: AMP-binding protein [unclassified Halomonas]
MHVLPNALMKRIEYHAHHTPQRIALSDGEQHLSYKAVMQHIAQRRQRLREVGAQRVALALDNGLEWALWDLALMMEARVAVPIPDFFSDTQRRHIVQQAGIDSWIGQGSETFSFRPTSDTAICQRRVDHVPALHEGTTRITFTSGTSGSPKGVCLDNEALLTVTESLAEIVAALDIRRHLAMLPLSTLLENIGGLYLPLWLGACSVLPGMASLGWQGASGFDATVALKAIAYYQPHSMILVPQLLQALVNHSPLAPTGLRFVAVGGAPVANTLLTHAQQGGWPVFEGYGLSECSSVVCLNRPGEQRQGVGRPLAHARLRIDGEGQLHVSGALMLGYLGEPACGEWHATGDTGEWQDESIALNGRQRDVFITAYGRNVNPQWVESELCTQSAIAQAMVYGEALPANRALIVPTSAQHTDAQLDAAIQAVNRQLPDYAQVHEWQRTPPFTPNNQQLTANGRLRRDKLLTAYGHWLQSTAPYPTKGATQ